MLEVGEKAPTLCGDWDTGDLAAHLVVRDRRPDALLGLGIPPLRGYTAKRADVEPRWRKKGPELLTGYRKAW